MQGDAMMEVKIEATPVDPNAHNDVSQMELIAEISGAIGKLGVKFLNPRQMNAIIKGANIILKELNTPNIAAKPNMGVYAWLQCDETGASSLYMAYLLCGTMPVDYACPHDLGDFDRCVKFLEAVEAESRRPLDDMRHAGEQWAALVDKWDELMAIRKEYLDGDHIAAGNKARAIFSMVDNLPYKNQNKGQQPHG